MTKRKKLVSATALVLLSLLTPHLARAANDYPEEVRKEFVKNCANSQSPANGSSLETFCICTFNNLESKYTLQEFVAIVESGKENEFNELMKNITTPCLDILRS